MIKMINIFLFALMLFIHPFICNAKTIKIYIDKEILELRYVGKSDFNYAKADILKVYPDKLYTIKVDNLNKLLIIDINWKKSDIKEDILYLQSIDNKLEVINYDTSSVEETLKDILVYDIDKDAKKEVVILWGDEETYKICVHKVSLANGKIKILNTFTSNRLVLPHLFNYSQLVSEYNNFLYFIYQYGGKTKKAVLTINPIDATDELYLKPIGIISKKEWEKMEANDNK